MAKTISVSIPHELGVAGARQRLESGLGRLGAQVPGGLSQLSQSWSGDTLNFSAVAMGQTIAGRIEVLESAVRAHIDLPGLMGLMGGRIKDALRAEGQKLLGRA